MFSTLCKLLGSRRSGRPDHNHRPRSLRLAFDYLEDRLAPATFTVTDLSDSAMPPGRGLDLRQAIALANLPINSGSTINFSVNGPITLEQRELILTQGMTITASSPAHAIAIEAAGLSRVFKINTSGALVTAVTLTGLTIKDGNTGNATNAAAGDGLGNGGGIYDQSGNLVLTSDLIENNTAVTPTATTGGNGGGVYAAGSLTLNGTTVDANNALKGNGGGIYSTSTVTLNSGSVVSNNIALAGGGIYDTVTGTGTNVTINNSTVTTNKATAGNGGGIYAVANVLIDPSVISNNEALGGTATENAACVITETPPGIGNGGGIYSQTGSVTSTNSTVTGNLATGEGGGIWAFWNAVLTGSTVSNNVGDIGGGGIWANSGFVSLVRTLVSGNTAGAGTTITNETFSQGDGGGIWSGTEVTIDAASTVTGNLANGNGGGIYANRSVFINGGTVSNNTANTTCFDSNGNPLNGNGGGIYALLDVTVGGGNVSGNSATANGGGIYSAGGNVDVNTGSTIGTLNNGNTAENGGGIYDVGGNVSIDSSSVGYNFADVDGGGVYVSGSPEELGSLYVNNSSFTSNTAVLDGGAIFVSIIEAVTVNGSTFTGNSATNGGAIYATSVENVAITNSTFTGNYAHSGSGGALYVAGPVDLYLLNDNFIGNSADVSGGAVYLVSPSGTTLTGTIYNCNFDDNVSYGGAHSGSDLFVDSNVTVDLNLTDFDDTPIPPAIAGPSASLGTDLIDVGNTVPGGVIGVINSSGGNTVWDNSGIYITNFGLAGSNDFGNDQA